METFIYYMGVFFTVISMTLIAGFLIYIGTRALSDVIIDMISEGKKLVELNKLMRLAQGFLIKAECEHEEGMSILKHDRFPELVKKLKKAKGEQ